MTDYIKRQDAIDAIAEAYEDTDAEWILRELPSAQPEPHYDEWCHSCKEYDQEKHSCPRWNKVIKSTVEELKSAQPEVIRCRECKFASGDSRICMKFGHSPIGELDFCAWAERIPNEREDTIREGDGTHEDGH